MPTIFKCKHCSFRTADKRQLIQHLKSAHRQVISTEFNSVNGRSAFAIVDDYLLDSFICSSFQDFTDEAGAETVYEASEPSCERDDSPCCDDTCSGAEE